MADILRDFPNQFQDKPHIQALVEAFAIEFSEVLRMFEDLRKLLEIDAVTDKLLDGIGDIVVLSRAEAGLLAKNGITFSVIDDERYRRFLKYKILRNTSTCNVEDILTAIEMLWGVKPQHYEEPPDQPATMGIYFEDPGGGPEAFDDIPPIKAAGVGTHIYATSERRAEENLYIGFTSTVAEEMSVEPRPKLDTHASVPLFAGVAVLQCDIYDIGRKAQGGIEYAGNG